MIDFNNTDLVHILNDFSNNESFILKEVPRKKI